LLGKNRLVTLTGSGGVGKTRLAIQVANKLVGKFKDSVWGLELLAWTDTILVPQAITNSLEPRKVAFAEAYEEGHVMSFDEAIEFALKETNQ
jgi:predicted ATPase